MRRTYHEELAARDARRLPDTIRPKAPDAITVTGDNVRSWFQQAVKGRSRKLGVPDDEQCSWLAWALPGIVQPRGAPLSDFLGKSHEPVTTVQRRLPEVRAANLDLAARSDWPEWYRAEHDALLNKMADAERALADLVASAARAERMLGGGHTTHHAAARLVQGLAATAWHRSGHPVPQGKRAGDPMCRFVHLALSHCGFPLTEHTVEDALRRREGRPRGGAKKG